MALNFRLTDDLIEVPTVRHIDAEVFSVCAANIMANALTFLSSSAELSGPPSRASRPTSRPYPVLRESWDAGLPRFSKDGRPVRHECSIFVQTVEQLTIGAPGPHSKNPNRKREKGRRDPKWCVH